MKLNLGSGNKYKEGWINIDINEGLPSVDLIHDLKDLLPYEDNSVEEIYASHVLEHITWCEATLILRDWYRVLIHGGIITVQTPNLLRYFEKLQSGEVPPGTFLYGVYGAREENEEHKAGFWPDLLREYFEEVGFEVISVDDSIFVTIVGRKK